MALPSLAKLMDWDLPTISQNISEEEVKIKRISEELLHSEPLQIQKVHWITNIVNKAFIRYNDDELVDPLLLIFSPPPEILSSLYKL
ncbi:hypothetical protein GNY06_11805 [Elizabethkingia argentiflava]|uniref:Uncharacterized protein n=1 Tax=Elizabethkingia argenteiflava TaxID=2681556 RepID=A0A845PXQ6_9FLAO|nr:hypothetical protein [Elizabethkingia argenteiflava]